MKNNIFEIVGNAFMYVLTAVQTKEIFQIIGLVLSIIISLIIIIEKIINWYKKANEDGKISREEINEIKNNDKEDIEDIKANVDEIIEIVEIEEQEKEK